MFDQIGVENRRCVVEAGNANHSSLNYIGNSRKKINVRKFRVFRPPSDKQFRSASMKTGRVRTTMEEECREILRCVEEAIAQEMCGASGIPPDDARMAACLHLQRAAQRPLMMNRKPAHSKGGNVERRRSGLQGTAPFPALRSSPRKLTASP